MRLRRWIVALALVGLLATFGLQRSPTAYADPSNLEFALIGDIPYAFNEEPLYLNLIRDINQARPAFTIHDGDFKSGSTMCSDQYFNVRKEQFGYFEQPIAYVFGDNEWTDCHRANNGRYDPLERLAKLRTLFTQDDQTLGQRTFRIDRESDIPGYEKFRENIRWGYGGVVFVGLNVPGSNNNLGRTPAADQEFYERNRANLAWLWQSFAIAQRENARGVMLILQADMGFELPANHPDRTGYNSFLGALEEATVQFGKPVVLVHGDSHYFRIDKPMLNSRTGLRVENFTRVETFGERDVHWVRARILPNDPNVFSFEPKLVQANLHKQ